MTTLKPFMNASRTIAAERKAEALERVVSMLLQGIALHSFESNTEPAEKFQNAIRKVRSDFDKVDDQDSTLLLAGSAIRLMEDYNNSVEQRMRARQNEFEAAIALLAEGLLEISRASAETMIAFKEIERDLASAPGVDALRRAKERLAIAVDSIRDEVANPLAGSAVPRGEVDAATGLPDYGFAADALAQIWQTRDRYYAAIFSAERLETINMRFGFTAGDQVLRTLSGHVAKSLAPTDRLFRWRGPCLMALIRRDAPEALVAAELSRTAQAKLEHAITMGGRDAMMSVSTTWSLFPLRTATGIDDVLRQMNTFAAGRVPARREMAVSRARA
jgi:GGDEF domain-containing protein